MLLHAQLVQRDIAGFLFYDVLVDRRLNQTDGGDVGVPDRTSCYHTCS